MTNFTADIPKVGLGIFIYKSGFVFETYNVAFDAFGNADPFFSTLELTDVDLDKNGLGGLNAIDVDNVIIN